MAARIAKRLTRVLRALAAGLGRLLVAIATGLLVLFAYLLVYGRFDPALTQLEWWLILATVLTAGFAVLVPWPGAYDSGPSKASVNGSPAGLRRLFASLAAATLGLVVGYAVYYGRLETRLGDWFLAPTLLVPPVAYLTLLAHPRLHNPFVRTRGRAVFSVAAAIGMIVGLGALPDRAVLTAPAQVSSPQSTAPRVTFGPVVRFTSAELGYRIDLPTPFRRSSCESRNWGSGTRGEVFVIAPEGEEVVTDSSLDTQAPGVEVIAEQNPDRVSAREWIDSNLHYGVGSMMGQQYEETVLDGRTAVLVRGGLPMGNAYVMPVGPLMYTVGGRWAASDVALGWIESSFHILSETERRALPTAAPALPVASRSAEDVADALADGFARHDLHALEALMTECMVSRRVAADSLTQGRARYTRGLASLMSNGLVVAVQARPIVVGPTAGADAYVSSTWGDAQSQAVKSSTVIDLLLENRDGRWFWSGTLLDLP